MGIGAHADDFELHFGGTIFKYLDKGYEAVYVMSTNNMSCSVRERQPDGTWKRSRPMDTVTAMKVRKKEIADAAKLYRTEPIHLDHPQRKCYLANAAGEMELVEVRYGSPLPPGVPENVPTILTAFANREPVEHLKDLILKKNPEVIFAHGYAEVNPEHHATFLLAVRAYWQAVEEGYQGSLLGTARSFNELGRMACVWETWVDVSGYLDKRFESVLKHESQYPADFAHGAKHWNENAMRRGRICGVEAAEVFNFVNPAPNASPETELLNELVANRATTVPWGFNTDLPLAADS